MTVNHTDNVMPFSKKTSWAAAVKPSSEQPSTLAEESRAVFDQLFPAKPELDAFYAAWNAEMDGTAENTSADHCDE